MNQPTHQFVISVMSRDRVGIVYEVASTISGLEGYIADLRQSVLCGYFTMILLASFPDGVSSEAIAAHLVENDPSFEVVVKPIASAVLPEPTPPSESSYVLTASGTDRIGFVATVTAFCAENQINILDLSTTVAGEDYIMILMVDVSQSPSIDDLRRKLRHFRQETGLNVVLQHHDIFEATNEVTLL